MAIQALQAVEKRRSDSKMGKKVVIHPGYFAPIDLFSVYLNAEEILWENEDNYQKQTYRNRQYIYGANGRLLLNIPVLHARTSDGKRQKYKDVQIKYDENWQSIHWKSLQSAYKSSPFFEFYADELQPLYQNKYKFLLDFNYKCWETLLNCLQIEEKNSKQTNRFLDTYNVKNNCVDNRYLIKAKRKSQFEVQSYPQVFQEKHGFIPNLTILDVLFNEGPQTVSYLKDQMS